MKTRELLLASIDEAFNKRSWHGTNLRGSLRDVAAHDLSHAGQIQLLKRLQE